MLSKEIYIADLLANHDLSVAIFAAIRTKNYNVKLVKHAQKLLRMEKIPVTKVNLSIQIFKSIGKRLDLLRAGTYFVDYDPSKHNFMSVYMSLKK